ncbi:hypothetical protein Pmani_026925 [Petrolisthes manimaculis]|uniref:Uncharacterized protein n=1 Tax=Petrolisthes manimaculis TaxID=1843537 RepID=A0AAE1P377_9EUCA|nr:hypothetical protein Pmani_026925 [Petrolisthes manimaculis]
MVEGDHKLSVFFSSRVYQKQDMLLYTLYLDTETELDMTTTHEDERLPACHSLPHTESLIAGTTPHPLPRPPPHHTIIRPPRHHLHLKLNGVCSDS